MSLQTLNQFDENGFSLFANSVCLLNNVDLSSKLMCSSLEIYVIMKLLPGHVMFDSLFKDTKDKQYSWQNKTMPFLCVYHLLEKNFAILPLCKYLSKLVTTIIIIKNNLKFKIIK